MRFLLLGGIGYIGGRLAPHLRAQGHFVRIGTRRPLSAVPAWIKADEFVSVRLDSPETVVAAADAIDIIVDMAAPDEIEAAKQPLVALEAGVLGTYNLLQVLCRRPSIPAFLYLSTFHVYGDNGLGEVTETTPPAPVHPYALGRYLGEVVVQSFRRQSPLRSLCIRLSNAFGSPASLSVPRWSLVFNDLCRQAVSSGRLTLKTPGRQSRNFITLHDAVRGIEFLAARPPQWPTDGLIHLGSPAHWTILDAARMVATEARRVLGKEFPIDVPESAPGVPAPPGLNFSLERLKGMGFTWENPVQREIVDTLRLCAPL